MSIVIEIEPLDPASGARVTLRFAAGDDAALTGLDDAVWWPGIVGLPALGMEGWDGDFTGSAQTAAATCAIDPVALRKSHAAAPSFRWPGARVRIHEGEGSDFSAWREIFTGLIEDYGTDERGQYRFTARVDTEPFDADLMVATYAGTGGAEGGDDLKGKVKPLLMGYARNVEPMLVDPTNWVYQVHGYGPIEGIGYVYERAAELVANGGSNVGDYPDYAALVAATIPEGSYGTALAVGMFRLGAPPTGLITCDAGGDNSGGYHRSTAQVIRRLCAIADVPSDRINEDSLIALDAAQIAGSVLTIAAMPINLYLTDSITVLDIVQQLARPCNAQAIVSWSGQLSVCRFGSIPTGGLTIDHDGRQMPPVTDVQEIKASAPYWRIEMQGRRCWRPQSKDEIAYDFISADDVVYGDGVPLEDLKPAQAGATAGAPSGTAVGDITVDDIVAALKAIALTSDPAEVLSGAQALADSMKALTQAADADGIIAGARDLVDRIRSADMVALEQIVLNQERKVRFDDLTHLDGKTMGTRVRQEIQERTEADEAIVTMITELEAFVAEEDEALLARIELESTVRASADEAETLQRELAVSAVQTLVEGEVSYLEASIEDERTTRATADAAETSQRLLAISRVDTDVSDVTAGLASEALTRASADQAETQQRELAISQLRTEADDQYVTVQASISNEATTRATADLAETTQRDLAISSLRTEVDGQVSVVEAAIASEASTRASADAAETSVREAQLSSVTTEQAETNAALEEERTTRASADMAEASNRLALAATVTSGLSDSQAALVLEQTARADGDLAETTAREAAVSSVSSAVGNLRTEAEAAIATEAITRATAIEAETIQRELALSTLQSTLDGQLVELEASIASEAMTRVDEDGALASLITALNVSMASSLAATNSAIINEAEVRASAISAEAFSRLALATQFADDIQAVTALVATEAQARSDEDGSLATLISGVETTANAASASVTTVAESVDGILAKWGLSLNSNGHIIGILANNDGASGGFDFVADYFRIWDTDGTISQPVFAYVDGVLKMQNIVVDTIEAGSGSSAQFANAMESDPIVGDGSGIGRKVLSRTVTLLKRGSICATAALAVEYTSSATGSQFSLVINGVNVFSVGGATTEISIILAGGLTLNAGTYEVEVYFAGSPNMTVHGRNLSTTIIYGEIYPGNVALESGDGVVLLESGSKLIREG